MIEEQANRRIQRLDGTHVLSIECETKYIEVLGHSLFSDRLWNNDDTSLNQPTQDHLRYGFPVLLCDPAERLIVEDIVLSFGKWTPRLNLDLVVL